MRELHFFETSNDHHKKVNVLNKICVWQHRGFVMGCLPDINIVALLWAAYLIFPSPNPVQQRKTLVSTGPSRCWKTKAMVEMVGRNTA